MKKEIKNYEVHFSVMILSGFNVELKATSEEEAQQMAYEMLSNSQLDDVVDDCIKDGDEEINLVDIKEI